MYRLGEVVKVRIGSAADVTITVEVMKNGSVVNTFVEKLSGTTKELTVPVTSTTDKQFSIHCSAVVYSSIVTRRKDLMIETDRPTLRIETETFKDKLQPGSEEQWSFIISGDNATKVESEVLASMYDASLDQFRPHGWFFSPRRERYSYSMYTVSGQDAFGRTNFIVRNASDGRLYISRQNYDAFDWFGFSIVNAGYANREYLSRLYFDATSMGKASKVTMGYDKYGRQGFVFGRVSSEGAPLPGVNVVVKGTTRGTVTDPNGMYSIQAKKDDVLVFSFVGLTTAEVKIGKKNKIDVDMEADLMQLSEVVVVGYGMQMKKNRTSAISAVVSYQDTTATDEIVFAEAVEGRVAGVQLSAPGKSYGFTIRGNTSTLSESQPLYVVDGVVVTASSIDHTDLAGMQVLNGAAATALYGSRGANGVILITTHSGQKKIDEELANVNARRNFQETAFFFPQLTTDEKGRVRFSFTTPESLTRWKLQLLAHTRDLLSTTKTLQAVTRKELMVTPNAPRFLRVGDQITFSAKIANLSGKKLEGSAGLILTDAVSGKSIDELLGNVGRNQNFATAPGENREVTWKLTIPQGVDAVLYKVVAKAGDFSDGEQNVLPVLSNRMLVTESLPLYVRSAQTKTFTLKKLSEQKLTSLKHHQLTLEITSNPAWYAIQSLPYLMEFPHECAEQLFARYYANSIASHIVNSNPAIREMFNKWSSSKQLVSPLEKNPELKSLLIEETPWLRDAQDETEQKKRMALLFDLKAMDDQLSATLNKMSKMQLPGGGFSWFAGGKYADRYITQHIASGYGHLVRLKITHSDKARKIIGDAVGYLDGEITDQYQKHLRVAQKNAADKKDDERRTLVAAYLEQYRPGNIDIHYLYMRSFYPELAQDEQAKQASEYYRKQAAKYWHDYNLNAKTLIALIEYRTGNKQLAYDIMQSLKENAVVSDELGMYWKENVSSWYWHEAPVETHAQAIEAFNEIQATDPKVSEPEKVKTIDELRIWLLKNKQTRAWRTTKATTEAAYALLLTGTNWITIDDAVAVTVGKTKITPPDAPEAGAGYFKSAWKGERVTNDMATVTMTKKGDGIAWGGLYWQYFEDLDKLTPAETPLKLTKKIYLVTNTPSGELLKPISEESLKPGDLIRIRIELSADREMEYLHMKDMRAAGLEPVDALSQYKWQEGLGYYQNTRDASTDFFFDRLPKGVYVFEYDLRVSNRGNFSNGITTIESMYAPEFRSHSEGSRVVVE
ncbi:MAG TPA: alpha-2-macroglobulin family protein, partial [Chryseosolibacter sp.]|nr:alpha-2-macroglobulin family protein [Chryseosolibacter sp.]